ncbi:MAG: hypothetical protein U9O98_02475 [Asgard group archaeon]|nr:hypothetical protein [Asgard group archaeon]
MTIINFVDKLWPNLGAFWNLFLYLCLGWGILLIITIIIFTIILTRRKKSVDISSLAALTTSEASTETPADANPKEVMAILSIERVAASTAMSAVKDARRSKKIRPQVAEALKNRYKARISKIDSDIKRRSSAQEYDSLAKTLEQSRDRLRGEVMPKSPVPQKGTKETPPPPPPPSGGSKTPGIPPSAPSVPSGPPKAPPSGKQPKKPSSPIPAPPKFSAEGPKSEPTKVVPPTIAPPSVSPSAPPSSKPKKQAPSPPTTSDMAPPPVPTGSGGISAAAASEEDQSIRGLRMEMLRELARLKKFMSEEGSE